MNKADSHWPLTSGAHCLYKAYKWKTFQLFFVTLFHLQMWFSYGLRFLVDRSYLVQGQHFSVGGLMKGEVGKMCVFQ